MSTRCAVLLAAALVVADDAQVLGQEQFVEPGDRVRVTAPTAYNQRVDGEFRAMRIEGELRELRDGSLLVKDTSGRERAIPVNAVTSLEVRAGGGSKAGSGALIGGLLGLATGAAIAAAQDPCTDYICVVNRPGIPGGSQS